MEGKTNRLILSILVFASLQVRGNYKTEIYSAYINNRMDQWKNVLERMEALPDKTSEILLELVNYQYGYIGYCIGFEKKDEARKYLEAARKNLDILDKRKYKQPLISAYRSAFYGFRIGLSPITAPVNGLKSIECAKEAVKGDPQNYFGYIQYGNIQFYMPKSFGGSKKEALDYYLRARELLEKEPDYTSSDWNYLSLLIVIAQTYTYLNDYPSAQGIYEYILKLEPGFIYVRDDLYPKLKKKMEKL
jgi:tetratricopeptide (TPR) repeat protein